MHSIQHKPDSSTILVWHDGGALHLELLFSVMKVDGDGAWGASKNEIEFEKESLFNSSHVITRSDLRAGEVDVTNAESEALTEGTESWPCNMLVEAWIAVDINILHRW